MTKVWEAREMPMLSDIRWGGSPQRMATAMIKIPLLALILAAAPQPAAAQTNAAGGLAQAGEAAEATAQARNKDPTATANEAGLAEAALVPAEDVRALVAPVALYPDPMLALVLQASIQPLQVVQASRFLDRRADDPALTPDPEWDPSVLGLLNYPRVLNAMNSYLDWTSALGDAVVYQLDDVQDAILDIRLSAAATGILASNDMQDVIVEGDVVRIRPADPKTVSVPEYDPAALLTAITPPEAEVASASGSGEAASAEAATAEASQPQAAPPPASQAAPPTYEAAPVPAQSYPVAYGAPPVVTYGEPETGFWDDAATFAGGAVVGGLLGWGLTEAFDDDDWDDYGSGRRNVNIEDSTVVVGDRRRNNAEVQAELRDRRRDMSQSSRDARQNVRQTGRDVSQEIRDTRERRDRSERAAAATRQASTASAASAAHEVRRSSQQPAREVRLPNAGTRVATASSSRTQAAGPQRTRTEASRPQAARTKVSGHAAPKKSQGLGASIGAPSQVRKEAARGAKSRVQAQRSGGGQKARARVSSSGHSSSAAVKHQSRGGGMASNVKRGGKARADADRGKQSRQAGGGGKRNRG
jgi:Protein of unknown function (DUF3300)